MFPCNLCEQSGSIFESFLLIIDGMRIIRLYHAPLRIQLSLQLGLRDQSVQLVRVPRIFVPVPL